MKTKIIILFPIIGFFTLSNSFSDVPYVPLYDDDRLVDFEGITSCEIGIKKPLSLLFWGGAALAYPIKSTHFAFGIEGAIEPRIYLLKFNRNKGLFLSIYFGSALMHSPEYYQDKFIEYITTPGFTYGAKFGYKFAFSQQDIFNWRHRFAIEPYISISTATYFHYGWEPFGFGIKTFGIRFIIEWLKTIQVNRNNSDVEIKETLHTFQ
jgi:hypothetical protein